MKKLLRFSITAVMMLFATAQMANNIQVSNISLTNQNTTDDYTMVRFNLTWENSWRTNDLNGDGITNWDAAWVFVKYRVGSGAWQHARLNNTGHSSGTGTGATIDAGLRTPGSAFNATTNPAEGVFIYRSANGTGTFSITGAQLRWNYGANGLADNAEVEVKVFAIEMAYVPQGAFTVGSGGTESGSFTNGSWISGATIALSISSENALTIGQSAGNLWGTSSTGLNTIGGAGTLPSAFPKGFAAFYSMKYEITQQQYVDFLNTLTQTQATTRKHTVSVYRYAITGNTVGSYATTNTFVACNHLSWMDGAAYSDWAGLRPMTELEFEKASRGTATQVANEYAWGTATIAGSAYTLSNAGQNSEEIATNYATTSGNASYSITDGSIDGPLRVGIFAANTNNTGRVSSGASYYGIMEMSGNLWERAVTVGNATGRSYTGVHGDGSLSSNGHANETFWPGFSGSEVSGAVGSGFRAGDWDSGSAFMRVSDRVYAASGGPARSYDYGFRAVRSVP